jgi:tRNA(Ile)-lysidine synthase
VSTADEAAPVSAAEAKTLFDDLRSAAALVLAVSGGPDSTALMVLAARWRAALKKGPTLIVVTVDHGLRAESAREARAVKRLASRLGVRHRTLRWTGRKPATGLQEEARRVRYRLLVAAARGAGARHVLTAHTLDDQAETLLMRLKRGSGLDGLAAIPMTGAWSGIAIERPLLDVAKTRLIATLEARGVGFVCDPSNADVRFERAQVRGQAGALAALGLTAQALALSARRLRRAREALDHTAESFLAASSEVSEAGYATVDRDALLAAPQEIALRALSRLIAKVGGGEEPLRLAKVETLLASLASYPGKTHTLGRCRIGPLGQQLGVFREVRAKGLPMIVLHPGMRALWDNRFRIELGSEERAVTVKALGERGLRDLRDRFHLLATLPPLASRTLPACFRGEALVGLPVLGSSSGLSQGPALACRASFIGAESPVKGGTA